MSIACRIAGCKAAVPAELGPQQMCISHFTLEVERQCNEMRLETVRGTAPAERREEINRFIAAQGAILAHVATGSQRMPDELKGRILSTFLMLMNLRENVERAAARMASLGSPNPSPAKA